MKFQVSIGEVIIEPETYSERFYLETLLELLQERNPKSRVNRYDYKPANGGILGIRIPLLADRMVEPSST